MSGIYEGGDHFGIRITGKDHVDLLHRITSNDVRGLKSGEQNRQCLLSAKGRIIAPFSLRKEDGNGAGQSGFVVIEGPLELKKTVIETIERYIFSEDVRIEPLEDIPGSASEEDERIRAGIPRWGADVDSETIPFEADLGEYVSTSKGCYTGQEVISRIETYGNVARRLMKLSCSASEMTRPEKGEISFEGKKAGAITSITILPRDGKYHALAMVHRTVAAGNEVIGSDGVVWRASELAG